MNIAVLVKPVPDILKVKFDLERGVVDRSLVDLEVNPFDLYAIELAVRVKEAYGGQVTAVSMAPPHGERALRDAISRGVDRAILLSDKRFAGADTLATSYTLATALRKLGSFDIVVCGEKSIDGDTGHVGPEVAEFLGIPHAAFVTHVVEVSRDAVVVESDYGEAYYQLELDLPALIGVSRPLKFRGGLVEPRVPKLSDVLRARRARVEVWSADDLVSVADPRFFGLEGSPTRVVRAYYALEKGRNPLILRGDNAVDALLSILEERGVIG